MSLSSSAKLTRRQFNALAGTVAATLLGVGVVNRCTESVSGARQQLICQHQRTTEEYARVPLTYGTTITLSWVHSIELTRWSDTFEYTSQGLMLRSTRFSSYGAGMPLDEGSLRIQDGMFTIEDINREFDAIRWIHSHAVDYQIEINDDPTIIDATQLPDREQIELRPS